VPVIVGELKRHFRDKSWDVRVPRRLQELCMSIARITDELTQRLSRSPTVADLASELGVSEEEVIEGLDCSNAYRALSLHAPVAGGDQANTELGELLGATDRDLENVEDREALLPLIACLPARDQRIISLRFFGNLTQSQIAAEVGVSQMHVSRLLSHALGVLRDRLLA
jgi:RNA polymerase sigma-B factor